MTPQKRIHMTPWERYQQDLERPEFHKDPAQEDAVRRLQSLYDKLVAAERERDKPMVKLRLKFKTVSYTHLTLPTICSV